MSVRSYDSAEGSDESIENLTKKILSRLSSTDFTSNKHDSAVRAIVDLQKLLADGHLISRTSQLQLLCAGVAIQRRVFVEDDIETKRLFRGTTTLVFVLIVTADHSVTNRSSDCTASMQVVARAASRSLWDDLKLISDGEDDSLVPPSELAKAAMNFACTQLQTAAIDDLHGIAATFFHAIAESFLAQQLSVETENDFLSLNAMRFAAVASSERNDESIANIVSAAESEMGQVVFRDLLLSFSLPRSVLGVRRVLIVTREAQQFATENHAVIVSNTHNDAMSGAAWCWENSSDEMTKICVLLAGVAMLTTTGNKEELRKADAFSGRVLLPFLETKPCAPELLRIALVPSSNLWVLHSLRNGKLSIESAATGLDGLLSACLALTDALARKK